MAADSFESAAGRIAVSRIGLLDPSGKKAGVRFAPSPTGAFHVGNFRSAWIAHYWARLLGAPFILRFEDIDAPRVVPGAMERQIEELEALGLKADQILVQSQFHKRHLDVFKKAMTSGSIYPCFCSRKDVREALDEAQSAPHGDTPIYSGTCRYKERPSTHDLPSIAWRFRNPAEGMGTQDFIIGRTDDERKLDTFVPAYNWACAIDDYDGNYMLLVRAWDLSNIGDYQRAIQSWLAHHEQNEFMHPTVFHTSLVVRDNGKRLEKRTKGVTLDELRVLGFKDEQVASMLAASFDPADGDVHGERRRTITLHDLGFRELD